MVNPPVRESDSNSQDEEKNDDSSVISSRSHTEDFGPDRHADLTSPDVCRVKHRRQVEGEWINVVCGALASVCHHENHPALREEVGGRGEAGWHVPVEHKKGWLDGDLSRRCIKVDEMASNLPTPSEDGFGGSLDGPRGAATPAARKSDRSSSREFRTVGFGPNDYQDDDSPCSARSSVHCSGQEPTPLASNQARKPKILLGPMPPPPMCATV